MKRILIVLSIILFTGCASAPIKDVSREVQPKKTISDEIRAKAYRYTCSSGHEHLDFLEEDFEALMNRVEVMHGK